MKSQNTAYRSVLVQLNAITVGTSGGGEICVSDKEKQRDGLKAWSAPSTLRANITYLYDTINHVDEEQFQAEPCPFAAISVQLREGHENIRI